MFAGKLGQHFVENVRRKELIELDMREWGGILVLFGILLTGFTRFTGTVEKGITFSVEI